MAPVRCGVLWSLARWRTWRCSSRCCSYRIRRDSCSATSRWRSRRRWCCRCWWRLWLFRLLRRGFWAKAVGSRSAANDDCGRVTDIPTADGPRRAAVFKQGLGAIDRFGAAFVRLVTRINSWIQETTPRLAAVSIAFMVVTIGLMLVLVQFTKVEYLPVGNRNLVIGLILPPPGYNLNQMQEMGSMMESKLRPFWDTDESTVAMTIPDRANPGQMQEVQFPAIGDFFYVARGRQIFMGLRARIRSLAAQLVPMIMSVSTDMPGVMTLAFQSSLFEQGLTARPQHRPGNHGARHP